MQVQTRQKKRPTLNVSAKAVQDIGRAFSRAFPIWSQMGLEYSLDWLPLEDDGSGWKSNTETDAG